MGAKPAMPRGWGTQMGRDKHAVGDGLSNTLGRVSRQRVQPLKRKRLTNTGTTISPSGFDFAGDPIVDSFTVDPLLGFTDSFVLDLPGEPLGPRLYTVVMEASDIVQGTSGGLDPGDRFLIVTGRLDVKADGGSITTGGQMRFTTPGSEGSFISFPVPVGADTTQITFALLGYTDHPYVESFTVDVTAVGMGGWGQTYPYPEDP